MTTKEDIALTKLNYLCDPENRLAWIQYYNKVDLTGGFLCELWPINVDTNADIFHSSDYWDSVTLTLPPPVRTGVIWNYYGDSGRGFLKVNIRFNQGELNQYQLQRIVDFLKSLH